MSARQIRTSTRWFIGFGAVLVAMGASTEAAHADETHRDSDNGPRVSLIQMGQVDDPLEDVLEHAALLGTTYVFD